MEKINASHDNVDVRMNNKITVHGNVVFIGSISVVGTCFLFLGIWMINNWAQALVLSAVLVYSFIGVVGLLLLGCVVAFWIKFVAEPATNNYRNKVEAQGQAYLNQVVHAQENAIVIADGFGVKVIPLLPQMVIEAPKFEPGIRADTVWDLHEGGRGLRDIADDLGTTYHQVQTVYAKEKEKREKAKKD
jgi:hypothetical protein